MQCLHAFGDGYCHLIDPELRDIGSPYDVLKSPPWYAPTWSHQELHSCLPPGLWVRFQVSGFLQSRFEEIEGLEFRCEGEVSDMGACSGYSPIASDLFDAYEAHTTRPTQGLFCL